MRKLLALTAVALLVASLSAPMRSLAEDTKPAAAPAAAEAKTAHLLQPDALQWGEGPPGLPSGAKAAVLTGDPGKAGFYTVRIQMPAGYRVMPHWHPMDEHVTVISGSFSVGMGDKFDKDAMQKLAPGGYGQMPAEMRHYAWSETGATIQVSGVGPFAITYVNPEDDPRNAKAEKK